MYIPEFSEGRTDFFRRQKAKPAGNLKKGNHPSVVLGNGKIGDDDPLWYKEVVQHTNPAIADLGLVQGNPVGSGAVYASGENVGFQLQCQRRMWLTIKPDTAQFRSGQIKAFQICISAECLEFLMVVLQVTQHQPQIQKRTNTASALNNVAGHMGQVMKEQKRITQAMDIPVF